MKVIETKNAPQAIGPYSQAIDIGDLLFTSGQIPLLPNGELLKGDVETQTSQVLKNLGAVLEAGGSDFNHVAKTTIFLASMEDFTKVNEIYSKFFDTHKPARSTVAVKTLPKNVLVEIEAIALKRN